MPFLRLETLLLFVPAALLAISIHEYAHAAVAYRLGDPTPRYQGRLTLNPLAHLDPIGTLLLVLFHFGWARPVPIQPSHFADPRRGTMLVALAGPVANLVLAYGLSLLASVLVPFLYAASPAVGWATREFVRANVVLNLALAAFNLIPLPPLDGSRILVGLLPARWAWRLARLETYGFLLLALLVVSGGARYVLAPVLMVLQLGVARF